MTIDNMDSLKQALKPMLRPAWRALRPIREPASALRRRLTDGIVRSLVARPRSRAWLNARYRRFGSAGQRRFYEIAGGAFREGEHRVVDGEWRFEFARREYRLPITSARIWLDWESALAALGHEAFIKDTYRTFLTGKTPPEVFVDIGANYGNHSLLFLGQGIDVLTFEPNSSCHAYFEEACRLNSVRPRLEKVALGAARGELSMSYPPRATWLGSVDPSTIEHLRATTQLVTERVEVRRLDEYIGQLKGRRVLIKIDAEGHEVSVLKGAEQTLRELRPPVLFESWTAHAEQRAALLGIFKEAAYAVADLPLMPGRALNVLDAAAFMTSRASDFVAFGAERLASSPGITPDSLFAPPPR